MLRIASYTALRHLPVTFRPFSRRVAMASTSSPPSDDLIACYVTVPDKDVGKRIATGLVQSRLAACVNMIPGVESIYSWQGNLTTDQELLLMIKSRASLLDSLTQWVRSNHPYTVCEVIAVPIQGGNEAYLNWVRSSTLDAPPPPS